MFVKIFYSYNDGAEKLFTSSNNEIIIGRDHDEITLDLPDKLVSRIHARLFYDIERDPRGWWIEDLGSRNGTTYQGEQIFEAVPVFPSQPIQVGKTRLRINYETAPLEGSEIVPFTSNHPINPSPRSVIEDATPLTRFAWMTALRNVSEVVTQYPGQYMLSSVLREMRSAFPLSEHLTIVLHQDGRDVVAAYWPKKHAQVSFTLVEMVVRNRKSHLYRVSSEMGGLSRSVKNATSAIYAPIIWMDRILGVIHVGTTSVHDEFGEDELGLLEVFANMVASGLQADDEIPMTDLPYVFISYSRKDSEFVAQLDRDLRRRKMIVWYDKHLSAGEEWPPQLATQIAEATAMVVVISPTAVESKFVSWEIATARKLGKSIYPLMYIPCDLPQEMRTLQYIDVGEDDETYERGINRLVDHLRSDLHKDAE